MAINNTRVQGYINDVITSKIKPYAFIGTTDKDLSDDSLTSQLNVWNDSLFVYKITKKDICGVVPNISYQNKTVYIPWSSSSVNSGKYYVYNPTTGIVYLCVSDNDLNRSDYNGRNVSNIIPTHNSGVVRNNDQYEWLALYRITAPLLKFVTSSWIPVISLEDFITEFEGTSYEQLIRFGSNPGDTGYCGVYPLQNTEVPLTSSTNDIKYSGTLFSTIFGITCKECYWLFRNSDNYISKFTGKTTPPSTITILDKFDTITNLIQRNLLSPTSPYYHLYQMAANGLDDGAVVSCFIDLSGLTSSQLTTTEKNPLLILGSSSGTSAEIQLQTYINSSGGYTINGIKINSRGLRYNDLILDINSSLIPNISKDVFLARIVVNFDHVDSLHMDPVKTLNCSTTSTLIRISTDDLTSNNITVPSNVNFYALVENPKKNIDSSNTIDLNTSSNSNTTFLIDNVVTGTLVLDVNSPAYANFQNITTSTNLLIGNATIPTIKQTTKVTKSPEITLTVNNLAYYDITLNGLNNNTSSIIAQNGYNIIELDNGYTAAVTNIVPSIISYNKGSVTKVSKISGLKLTDSSKLFSLNSIVTRQ